MFHTKSELQNKTELYQATCGNKQSFCIHCIDWTQIMLCIMDGTWVMAFYRCVLFDSNETIPKQNVLEYVWPG